MFTLVWLPPKPTPVVNEVLSFSPDSILKTVWDSSAKGCVVRLHEYILIGMAIFKANFTILFQR